MDTIKTVRKFISESFLFSEDEDFQDNDSLLENGIIDSTGVLELVTFLEQTFGIKVDDEEIVPENLDSLCNIACYVARKLSGLNSHSIMEWQPATLKN